jgi:hypothetical protein
VFRDGIGCSIAGASLIALGCTSAMAQQVTGVPSPPEATITGKQTDPKFGGVITVNASDSKA